MNTAAVQVLSLRFRAPEESLENLVPQAQQVLKVPEEKVASWASQDPRETGETWVHPDHL